MSLHLPIFADFILSLRTCDDMRLADMFASSPLSLPRKEVAMAFTYLPGRSLTRPTLQTLTLTPSTKQHIHLHTIAITMVDDPRHVAARNHNYQQSQKGYAEGMATSAVTLFNKQ
jgi:hypothetical protein